MKSDVYHLSHQKTAMKDVVVKCFVSVMNEMSGLTGETIFIKSELYNKYNKMVYNCLLCEGFFVSKYLSYSKCCLV